MDALSNGARSLGSNFGNEEDDEEEEDDMYHLPMDRSQDGLTEAQMIGEEEEEQRRINEESMAFESKFEMQEASRKMIEAGAGSTVNFVLNDPESVKTLVQNVEAMEFYLKWHCKNGKVPQRVSKHLIAISPDADIQKAFAFESNDSYKGHVITYLAWLLVAEGDGGTGGSNGYWKNPNWRVVVSVDGTATAAAAPAADAAAGVEGGAAAAPAAGAAAGVEGAVEGAAAPAAVPLFSEVRVIRFIKEYLIPRGKVRRDKGTQSTHAADEGGRFGLMSVASLKNWMLSLQSAVNETSAELERRGGRPPPIFKTMHEYVILLFCQRTAQ
jgi:hypothetical protein